MISENIVEYNGVKGSLIGINAIGKIVHNVINNEFCDLSTLKRGRKYKWVKESGAQYKLETKLNNIKTKKAKAPKPPKKKLYEDALDPFPIPKDIEYFRENKDECIKMLTIASSIVDGGAYDDEVGRFIKGRIVEKIICEIDEHTLTHKDKRGYDISNANSKFSIKSERSLFSQYKQTHDIIMKNENSSLDVEGKSLYLDFDYLILAQTGESVGMAICTYATYEKYARRSGSQIKVQVPYEELFWIVKPNESKGFVACDPIKLQEIDDEALQKKINLAKQQNGYK